MSAPSTATPPRLMTFEEFLDYGEPGVRYELVDGVPVEMPQPNKRHQWIVLSPARAPDALDARIDGAGSWTQFWRITLPLLSPTLFLVALLILLSSLTAFGQIHLLTRGGPMESTMVWIYRVYQDAFFNFRFYYASAQAVALFLVLLLLAALQFRFFGRRVHYG
ncbi:MAG: ABC transporter permease subunit [Acidobacteriota bacterium]|nr:ABC transporter permease subunit [Acidobacteriota bacterium]